MGAICKRITDHFLIVLQVVVVAASIVMDIMQRALVKEGEKEVQDIFRGERVERFLVGSEVVVVYVFPGDLAVVVVSLGEVAGLIRMLL